MKQKLYILTEVNISEGSNYDPYVRGVFQTHKAAEDNAVIGLCGIAHEYNIPEDNVDTTALRLADDTGTIAYLMKITEVEMELNPVFQVC